MGIRNNYKELLNEIKATFNDLKSEAQSVFKEVKPVYDEAKAISDDMKSEVKTVYNGVKIKLKRRAFYNDVKLKVKRQPIFIGTKAVWDGLKRLPQERDPVDLAARVKLAKDMVKNEAHIMAELLVEDLIVMAQEMKRDVEGLTKQIRGELGEEVSEEFGEELKGKIKELKEETNELGEKVDELEERVDKLGNMERGAANVQKNLQYYFDGVNRLRQEDENIQVANKVESRGRKGKGKFSPDRDGRL